ncbi:uncharacterized protein K452DRAFT_286058 [Aplosporella prunicola CBS 121167]|uniref:Uncharacterized protein n=1 Tax=Aplosporella prunicola CBS 121167 TaxID=1176127 RepID=A0A6A6BIV5_9PEZI|nr:uncharacterized protein K452DRAFT_286058 [Aplosporella prunicola CBS 121167]KAF2143235.1 hypothetical protein K452DRAFT_286058 [Aplosporella prunicola CBS 121167]
MSAPVVNTPLNPYAVLHATLDGPGDMRPSAMHVIRDGKLINAWPERNILVTGASAGLGLETARALHATGATLYLGVRDATKGEAAKTDILSHSPGRGEIRLLELDLASLASVRAAAASLLERSGGRLDILVNNAGIMATPEAHTADGFELQLGTNYLGPFLLTALLVPALQAAATPARASRVVNLSSRSHLTHSCGQIDLSDLGWQQRGYDAWAAYGASMTASILHANELDRRLGTDAAHPVHGLSVNPGAVMTGLFRHLPPDQVAAYEAFRQVFKSPEQGAATAVWAACAAALEGCGQLYCEDCGVGSCAPADGSGRKDRDYAPWAMGDTETEARLWAVSEGLVGL